ncbi:hypothetical protein PWT90_01084 [Aphanocladium album]|nr:hypothetical protein PWT90_01084 [Aphanocladium album]
MGKHAGVGYTAVIFGPYTVPQFFANAASSLSTSSHNESSSGLRIAEDLRRRFQPQSSDTNRQGQMSQASSGLLGSRTTAGGRYRLPPTTDDGIYFGSGNAPGGGTGQASPTVGYSDTLADSPDGVPIALKTTSNCGKWHVAKDGDTCQALQLENGIASEQLMKINRSINKATTCDQSLVPGSAYCVSPLRTWDSVVSVNYNSRIKMNA